ncbi:MAG: glycosyltransferase family 2 protein [Candidatus Heimdallarchaeota archaeon]|nr:glycosyltransferase family 2 protein [Candidatus Heimdallarchaeota archaeon]
MIYLFLHYPIFIKGYRDFYKIRTEKALLHVLNGLPDPINFILQYTTRGEEIDSITIGLERLSSYYSLLDKKIQRILSIDILTESQSDKTFFDSYPSPIPIRCVLVPETYQTRNNTKFKARALQYLIEQREFEHKKLTDLFIIHLDAESVLPKSSLISLLYGVLSQPDKQIFQGPIVYPINWKFSGIISRQMESLRPWNCHDCLHQTIHGTPYHLHGSNLVIRADVELLVGWDYRPVDGYPVVAEDLFFGIKASLLGKDIFGWHGALLLEQPAMNVSDSLRQRVRWIRGSLQALQDVPSWPEFDTLSSKKKNHFTKRIRFKLYMYAIGFIPALLSNIILITVLVNTLISVVNNRDSPVQLDLSLPQVSVSFISILSILGFFGLLLWLFSVQIGLYYNLKSQEISILERIREHIKIMIISPLAAIIDTGIVFLTIVRWYFGSHATSWKVTPKSIKQLSE